MPRWQRSASLLRMSLPSEDTHGRYARKVHFRSHAQGSEGEDEVRMIIFSKALADQATVWEALRASESCENLSPDLLRFSAQTKPVVMWNLTQRCNLACKHCYMDASRDGQG